MKYDISILITTYNDNDLLDLLLKNISQLNLRNYKTELIILDAGEYTKKRVLQNLDRKFIDFIFLSKKNLGREKSLNVIFNLAKGRYLIRLDARTKICKDYVLRLVDLLKSHDVVCAGGMLKSIGKSSYQKRVASIMNHPFSFGFAPFRISKELTYVNSVYLGAYDKKKCEILLNGEKWFEENYPVISEDSELNYRLIKEGGKIICDPLLEVQHYPRESIKKYKDLCINYGKARAYFLIKHKKFSAPRQLVAILLPPLLICISFFSLNISIILFTFYFFISLIYSKPSKTNIKETFLIILGVLIGHASWIYGLYITLIKEIFMTFFKKILKLF